MHQIDMWSEFRLEPRRYRGTEEARQAEREELAQTQLCLLEYLDLDDRVATYVTKHVEIAL